MYKIVGGILKLFMGNGQATYSGENVAATSSAINSPMGLSVDGGNGDVYISSYAGHRIQVVTASTGLVSTFVGTGVNDYGGDGGDATAALINGPSDLMISSAGNLYIAEYTGFRIRKTYPQYPTLAPSVVPTTASPTCVPTRTPSAVPTTAAPSSKRYPYNAITTIAGSGAPTTPTSIGAGGLATAASLSYPRGIWVDSIGTVYWSEWTTSCVRKFSSTDNIVVNVAGMCGCTTGSINDNVAATSVCLNIFTIFGNTAGTLYAPDLNNNRVRKISATGIITTAAGSGDSSNTASTGNYGPATSALLYGPAEVFVNPSNVIYINCKNANLIRYVVGSLIYPLAGKFSLNP